MAATAAPQAADALRDEIEKRVRDEWAPKLRQLYDTERARARADGEAAAVAEAQAAAAKDLARTRDELRERVKRAVATMEEAHRAALSKLESSVGEVAFAALCRLVSRQLASRVFTLDIVERTCAALHTDVAATVRLHPRDIDMLWDLLPEHELRVRSHAMQVIPDESLALGGCVIEAASGKYDGGIESQLRRLHAVLAKSALAQPPANPDAAAEHAVEEG